MSLSSISSTIVKVTPKSGLIFVRILKLFPKASSSYVSFVEWTWVILNLESAFWRLASSKLSLVLICLSMILISSYFLIKIFLNFVVSISTSSGNQWIICMTIIIIVGTQSAICNGVKILVKTYVEMLMIGVITKNTYSLNKLLSSRFTSIL